MEYIVCTLTFSLQNASGSNINDLGSKGHSDQASYCQLKKKKMKLGYQVESSEIYVRRDPLDHETFFGHHKITRAPQYSSLRPVITVLPQTLKRTRTS